MSEEIRDRVQDVTPVNKDNYLDSRSKEEAVTDITNSDLAVQKHVFGCEVCNIKVTSSKILQRHLEGRKHKMRVERQGKSFKCELCEVNANSETQLNIHLSSSKHKAKLQKKEMGEFTNIYTSRGIWIVIFCVFCVFINLLLLFKNVF